MTIRIQIIKIIETKCFFYCLRFILLGVIPLSILYLVSVSIFGIVTGYSEGKTTIFGLQVIDRQTARDILIYIFFSSIGFISSFLGKK